jgi:hypothetical protein
MTVALATCLPEHANRPRTSSQGECNSCYSRRKFQENPHLLAIKKRREHERYLEKRKPKLTEPVPCRECRDPFVRRTWRQIVCNRCRSTAAEKIKWRACDECATLFFRKSNGQKYCTDCSKALGLQRVHRSLTPRETAEVIRRPKVATQPTIRTQLEPTVLSQPEEPQWLELPPFRPLLKVQKNSGLQWAHRKFDPDIVRSMTADPLWGWHDD